jgi:16S rRNA (uracil1498-N3)-methyltransferase
VPHSRFFIDKPFAKGETVTLENEEFHHLARVMRIGCGEIVQLASGKGQLATAEVEKIAKSSAHLKIISVENGEEERPKLILAQALARMPKLEWIIEKGVELGVSEFWLFPSMQSEIKTLTPSQSSRLNQIAISAMKQSGRLWLPLIRFFPSWDKLPKTEGVSFFGDLTPGAPSLLAAWKNEANLTQPLILFIGPEKGFKTEEHTLLQKERHALGIKLHTNVLRTETAALAGLTLLHALSQKA